MGLHQFQVQIRLLMFVAVASLAMAITATARNPSVVSGEVTQTGVEQVIDAGSLKVASAAVATPDGGLLIAGGYRTDQYNRNVIRQFYIKISGAPSIVWIRYAN